MSMPAPERLDESQVAPPELETDARAARLTAKGPGASPGRARRWRAWGIAAAVLLVAAVVGVPRILAAWRTVSTDDAYVNGHVTLVAARVPGKVVRVLVEDNNRVRKGDLLVQLDKEPYQVQVNIAQAAVAAARSDLITAQAQARGTEGQIRSLRFSLEHAIEQVDNQVALLRSKVATLASQKAAMARAQIDYDRALPLLGAGAIAQEELDHRKQTLLGAQAQVEAALQEVHQIRAGLGLTPVPDGADLARVPPDLDQTFSAVRQAQASLIQAAAQLGVVGSFNQTPRQMIAEFYKRDPQASGCFLFSR